MAGLSVPPRGSGKDQMLERYLNLMAEQRQRQQAIVLTTTQNTQEIDYVKKPPRATQEVPKNSRKHEEWKESTTKSQETYWNLLDVTEEAGTTTVFAKRSRETEKLQASLQRPSSSLLDFQEESGLVDLSPPQRLREPEESQADHEETSSALFDLEEVVSDETALSSPQKAQETDAIQEAEYNQDTEGTEESEADHEDDDQWWGLSHLEEDHTPLRMLPSLSELPGKVRRQIWNFARPEARYIKIRESKWSAALCSDAPIPALLHTCQESRKVALKWYDLSFARDPEMGFWDQKTLNELMNNALTKGQRAQARIYFDWERDGIYSQCARCNAHRMSCRHAPLSFDWLRVKRLAYGGPLSINPFYKLTLCYPAVESIMLIHGRSAVRRTAVSPSEFIPVIEKFEWEGDDLLATCLETLQNTGPECDALETITSVQRMTLMDVNQTKVVDRTESSYWPCR
ncbi:uncharacterized protein Bfra_002244 [Botrytis fragariae]|uniref:2EXR domain-containing protein n=1 Tax=Botrytis fragariae TaxID=1964551 RepID=A0A8H6AYA4_9HELO|nr:uncharacterized protein Bfra_002244 [Botrytis fragariae]KAF5875848.1 hypothetical protein Bfra_002244 [Botrytis fragariae]